MTDDNLKRLKPSEVTEPGFYWIRDVESGNSPMIVVEVAYSSLCKELRVYEAGSQYDLPLDIFEDARIFIGPLTPPEDA